MVPAKIMNSNMLWVRGRKTAILAPSCITHTAHRVPLTIHCTAVQAPWAFRFLKYFLMVLYERYHTRKDRIKAIMYPLQLFHTTEVIPEVSALKTDRIKKVVETGIFSLVRIRRISGAMICQKLKLVGCG